LYGYCRAGARAALKFYHDPEPHENDVALQHSVFSWTVPLTSVFISEKMRFLRLSTH
jgi:hypothetical protein